MTTSRKGKKPALRFGAAVLLGVVATTSLLYRGELRSWYLLATKFVRLAGNAQGYPEYRKHIPGLPAPSRGRPILVHEGGGRD